MAPPGSEVSENDPLPRRFGPYLLFDKIGEGGMARIYLARASSGFGAQRLVVVKQILPILSSSDEFSKLLIDEAKLAARLNHGNVAQVIDLGREDGRLFIAMEYVEGFDLRELLRSCSKDKIPLPLEYALLVVLEALRGLDYAHRKNDDEGRPLGIVHRDVSPSNVLISFDGEVKICDFGIARAIGAGDQLPADAVQGKAGYMSPEAARGDDLDARSDVFAAGIILWELCAGRRMYKGEGGKAPTLAQATTAFVPPLPARGAPDEARLHAIVARALARKRDDRYESARAMLKDLEDYVVAGGLVVSPLRFGEWMMTHFGSAIVERRSARERAAKAIDRGPLLSLAPLAPPPRVADPPPPPSASEPVETVHPAPMEPPPASLQAMVTTPTRGASPRGTLWVVALVAAGVLFIVAALTLR